jgi:hypothetical protein
MTAHVAAVRVFGAASKVVDGRDTPGHDVRKAPLANTVFDRAALGSIR